MRIEYNGVVYEYIGTDEAGKIVYFQSVNDDSRIEVDMTTLLHSPAYKPLP